MTYWWWQEAQLDAVFGIMQWVAQKEYVLICPPTTVFSSRLLREAIVSFLKDSLLLNDTFFMCFVVVFCGLLCQSFSASALEMENIS
jgi:hypothetical protein